MNTNAYGDITEKDEVDQELLDDLTGYDLFCMGFSRSACMNDRQRRAYDKEQLRAWRFNQAMHSAPALPEGENW